MGGETGLERYDARLLEDLVQALEMARSRLAVCMAAENKRILPDRRKTCAETEADLRSLLKCLRSRKCPIRVNPGTCARGLANLRNLLSEEPMTGGGSLYMCARLQEILVELGDFRRKAEQPQNLPFSQSPP